MIEFIASLTALNFKNMGVKKITISHKRRDCIGCGICALLAPQNWSMDDQDGLATLKDAKWKGQNFMVAGVDEDLIEENKIAAANCPVAIIRIEE